MMLLESVFGIKEKYEIGCISIYKFLYVQTSYKHFSYCSGSTMRFPLAQMFISVQVDINCSRKLLQLLS